MFVLLGYKNRSLLTKHNWAMLEKLWPALTSAQHNEKPSIIKLFDWISEAVFRGLDTFAIKVELSDEVRSDLAKAVFESDSPLKPRTLSGEEVFPESEERSKGLAILQQQNEANLLSYHGIIDKLCEQVGVLLYELLKTYVIGFCPLLARVWYHALAALQHGPWPNRTAGQVRRAPASQGDLPGRQESRPRRHHSQEAGNSPRRLRLQTAKEKASEDCHKASSRTRYANS